LQSTISKWGNSLALRLPRHIAEQAQLFEGGIVELTVDKRGALTIMPARKKPTLAELLEGHPPHDQAGSVEINWGEGKGDEAW
jgi:antitoxin MazE